MMTKQEIRKQILAKRNALHDDEVKEKSHQICVRVRPYIKGCVALYESYGKEVQVQELKQDNSCYALPRTNADHTLTFLKITDETIFETSSFQIVEPVNGEEVKALEFDVILIPLVAFDESCGRLGHGIGFYDRYLKNTKALTIGIAYELQKVDEVVMEPWDQYLDMIITEKALYQCR